MKVFFDRLIDLLCQRKDLVAELKGMKMMVISCGSDENARHGFDLPFVQTAAYLKMKYKGHLHTWTEHGEIPDVLKLKISQFV